VSSKWARSYIAITYTEHTTQTTEQFYATIKYVPLLQTFSKFDSAQLTWLQNTPQVSYKERPVSFGEITVFHNHRIIAQMHSMGIMNAKADGNMATTVFQRVRVELLLTTQKTPSVLWSLKFIIKTSTSTAMRFHYKCAVQGNNRCLLWNVYGTYNQLVKYGVLNAKTRDV
jgi:hypothetical protein